MILDGKAIAKEIKENIKREIDGSDFQPGLAVIIVGDDPASHIYVNSKEKAANQLGFHSVVERLPHDTTQEELLNRVRHYNDHPDIDGILVQVPLPDHINEAKIIETINPEKDVDCFHPYNFGRLFAGNQVVEPCTPKGSLYMLDHYGIDLKGMNALVIGRSNIVGKPIALMLLQRHATVTIAHSRTKNLAEIASQADLIVAAIGKPEFIGADMVKEGAVIIDVGINRVEDPSTEKGYRVVGDVDYEAVKDKTSAITPVPGGVGATTIPMLFKNTLQLAKLRRGR